MNSIVAVVVVVVISSKVQGARNCVDTRGLQKKQDTWPEVILGCTCISMGHPFIQHSTEAFMLLQFSDNGPQTLLSTVHPRVSKPFYPCLTWLPGIWKEESSLFLARMWRLEMCEIIVFLFCSVISFFSILLNKTGNNSLLRILAHLLGAECTFRLL